MNPKLHPLFETLEADRKKLLNELSGFSQDKLGHRSASGKWSVCEILTHILVSEKISLGYMKKKSLGVDSLANSGWFESVKISILKISQRIPFKYKAPKVVIQNTPEALALPDLIQQWDSLRNDMRNFLEKVENKNIRKKIYRHPVGRFDVVQAVTFFREHFHHHLPQIKRLLK